MALVKYGNGVAGMSGKIAGNVAARNRSGAYMRQWTKPINPGTAAQSLARARFSNHSSSWASLTTEQRQGWNDAAAGLTRLNRLGDAYVPTGRQLFIEANSNMVLVGEAPFTGVPSNFSVPKIGEAAYITATVALDVLTSLDGDAWVNDAALATVFDAVAPTSTTRANVNNRYRFVSSVLANGSPDLLAAYTALFGNAASADQAIQYRLRVVDLTNGMSSPYLLSAVIL